MPLAYYYECDKLLFNRLYSAWKINTWRRSTELDVKKKGLTWKQLERIAQDRRGWKLFINVLYSERNIKA